VTVKDRKWIFAIIFEKNRHLEERYKNEIKREEPAEKWFL